MTLSFLCILSEFFLLQENICYHTDIQNFSHIFLSVIVDNPFFRWKKIVIPAPQYKHFKVPFPADEFSRFHVMGFVQVTEIRVLYSGCSASSSPLSEDKKP